MTLVRTAVLLAEGRRGGYAVGAFNVIGLEHAQAIAEAAAAERSPAILQLSENAVRYHLDGLEVVAAALRALAQRHAVPLGLHLDHATSVTLCARAIAAGFGSVMIDAAALEFEANAAAAARVVGLAHPAGVGVEAELGVVGGKGGPVDAVSSRTDPALAREFVARTGIDALAVAVGTSHRMAGGAAELDLGLLRALAREVPVPLVLHGASGVADAQLREAIAAGIAKVNVATQLNLAFTAALRRELAADPEAVDPRRSLGAAREAVTDVVRRYLRLLGSAGRA